MDQTIEWYLQRLESVRGIGEDELIALLDLSRALMENMEFEHAEAYLEEALALSDSLQLETHQRDIHGLLAIAGINLQDIDSTYEHAQQAIALSHDDHDHLLEHYATLMIVLIMTPPDSPPHDYAQALIDEMRDGRAEDVVIHQMVQMLAETYGMSGNADRAIEILEAEVERAGNSKWFALMQLGSIEIALGMFNDGYRHLKEARQVASDRNDKEAEVVILLGLGSACIDTERFDNGIRFLKSALDLTRESGDTEMEQLTLGELGNAYAYAEKFDDAEETFKELIDLANANQDTEAQFMGWTNTGLVYRETFQFTKAIEAYDRALSLSRRLNNPFEEAEILIQLGQVYASSGKLDRGVAFIEEAVKLFDQLGEQVEGGDAYLTIAELYADHNRIPEVLEAAHTARQIFEQYGAPDLISFVDEFIEDLEE